MMRELNLLAERLSRPGKKRNVEAVAIKKKAFYMAIWPFERSAKGHFLDVKWSKFIF